MKRADCYLLKNYPISSKTIFMIVLMFILSFNIFNEFKISTGEPKHVNTPVPRRIERYGEHYAPEATTLTIYTYESLINWGLDPTEANAIVFDAFANDHNISIDLIYYDDANEILTVALEEMSNPKADIIIGLDNILVFEAKKQNLFEKYDSPVLTNISSTTIDFLDPDHYLLPYDMGPIGLIYKPSYFAETHNLDQVFFDEITLEDMFDKKISKEWVTENPLQSSTGLGFFLWTVAVCDYAPHGPDMSWEEWWEKIDEDIQVESSWSDTWVVFDQGNRHMMTSYATDGAFSYLFYEDTSIKPCLTHENGKKGDAGYSWLQVEGLGIINGTPHQSLAREFVDWFLSPTVQEIIPENNWMFPANSEVSLPPSYDYAVNISKVEPLNDLVPSEDIELNLGSWLDKWERIIIEEKGEIIVGFEVFILPAALIMLFPIQRQRRS